MKIKSIIILFIAVFMSFSGLAQSKKVLKAEMLTLKAKNDSLRSLMVPKQNLESKKDTFSYAMGVELYVNNFKAQDLDTALNIDAFYLGLKNAELETDSMPATMKESIIRSFFAEIEAKKKQIIADRNLADGQAFLAQNAKNPGVVSLPSGLQYKVLKAAPDTAKGPRRSDRVKVHYAGRLINGKEFDSSYKRNKPSEFGVTQVIKGWTEILQFMKEGDKWEVYIPSNLAYGVRGSRSSIGPNETLIFVVELLEVKPNK